MREKCEKRRQSPVRHRYLNTRRRRSGTGSFFPRSSIETRPLKRLAALVDREKCACPPSWPCFVFSLRSPIVSKKERTLGKLHGKLPYRKVIPMESNAVAARHEILQRALALDPADRAFLADELERSLPQAEFTSEDVVKAWSTEIDRRFAAYDRGDTTSVSLDAALGHIRRVLDDHRSRRANP